jgi:hypothetical protein
MAEARPIRSTRTGACELDRNPINLPPLPIGATRPGLFWRRTASTTQYLSKRMTDVEVVNPGVIN